MACIFAATWIAIVTGGCGRSSTDGGSLDTPTDGDQATAPVVEPSAREAAEAALRTARWPEAEQHLLRYLEASPKDFAVWELAGDVALRQDATERACQYFARAIPDTGRPTQALLEKLARHWTALGRPFEALEVLELTARHYPESRQVRRDIAGLAAILGIADVALPHVRWLVQHGEASPETLTVLAAPARTKPDRRLCQTALDRYPSDLRPHYSLALAEAARNDWQAVAIRLQPVIDQHPDFVPASLLFGRALIELNETQAVAQWHAQLSPEAKQHSAFWRHAGTWADRQQRPEQAVRAFWEAAKAEQSSNGETLVQLMVGLRQIGRTGEAQQVAERVDQLSEMRDLVDTFFERGGQSQADALRVARKMAELGRLWEAEGWSQWALSLRQAAVADAREFQLRIRQQLNPASDWQQATGNIALALDLEKLPLPEWSGPASNSSPVPDAIAREPATSRPFQFQDEAAERGLNHTCAIAPEALSEGHWIYQSVGGGIGVIDFDLDGWPDLSAAMLDGQPLKQDSGINRLFQNWAGQFHDVTTSAGLADHGFGQGICVGDYNDDGFPDIFDANIGVDRLYRNNGDGTFSDVTEEALGTSGQRATWTTSAAIADLDADGIADLFLTQYCAGNQPYQVRCGKARIATCPPLEFDAEPDRVLRGRGDGTFEDVTDAWFTPTTAGRGLGVIVGPLDAEAGLDVYVANDMTGNHLWSAQLSTSASANASPSASAFSLQERAAISGLAFSGKSLSQASMGMAAGDADEDGDLDILLTHFESDHNTYYEQVSPGLWADRSARAGFAKPSMPMLGFGCELADFNNDGRQEWIVTNGHVDDLTHQNILYKMPPQLFAYDRIGSWWEWDRQDLGEYFRNDHLGRALVTLDANRDGLIDVAITHLYEPISLLICDSPGAGNSLRLTVKSRTGQRDAIGTRITATIGERTLTAVQLAGDGYMCSNEKQFRFGLGDATEVDQLTVQWPTGKTETFGPLRAGQEWLLVEGLDRPFDVSISPAQVSDDAP